MKLEPLSENSFGTITKVNKASFHVQADTSELTSHKLKSWIGTKLEVGKRVCFAVDMEKKPNYVYVVEVK